MGDVNPNSRINRELPIRTVLSLSLERYLWFMAATLTKTDKINLLFNQPVWMVTFQITERSLRRNKFGSIKNLYRRAVTGTRRLKNLSNRDFFKTIDLGMYSWRQEDSDTYWFSFYFTMKEGSSLNEKRLKWQLKRTITWNPIDVWFGLYTEPPINPKDNLQFVKGLYGTKANKSDSIAHGGHHQALQPVLSTRAEAGYYREHY